MSELLDSGARRKFESGAERDISEGKGRCDLLPLDVVARLLGNEEPTVSDSVLISISAFVRNGDSNNLYCAIYAFCNSVGIDIYTAMLEVSKQYEDGARKYSERNWEKGMNLHCYIDSGVRHYLKFRRGDKDEPHDRAFIWNMLGALWTHRHLPELNDLPFEKKSCTLE